MGSFDATCSITDLSIGCGTPTYMQLILPTWVKNPYSIDGEEIGCGEKGLRVSNEGAMAEFVPFGFPIEGVYSDYGSIENIVRDRNVEMLEKYFNISIDDIIECATDDRWYRYSYKDIEKGKKEEYKGRHDSWTVGGNEMKNLKVLKQLTVTYFRKEHYDFLSEEFKGDDDYWMKESGKCLKKLKKGLKRLAEHNAEKESKKPVIKKVTSKMLETYRTVFKNDFDGMSDEEVSAECLRRLNYSANRTPSDLDHVFLIPSIANVNMYFELPLTEEDYPQAEKQYKFMINMHSLYKVLRPSYGSHTHNYGLYTKFHKFSTELISKEIVELFKDDIGYYISEALENEIDDDTHEKVMKTLKNKLANKGFQF